MASMKGEKKREDDGSAEARRAGRGARGGERASTRGADAPVRSSADAVPPRLAERYAREVRPALVKQFGYRNVNEVPRLERVVLNMGLGAAVANPKLIDSALAELSALSGQKPVVTRARKAIANFKLRAGLPIGAMVTLRRTRMWEFVDRLLSLALPRMRDFRGVSRRAFDGRGNYTLGLREQIIFPEIDYDRIDAVKGMNISFVTTARTDEEGRALLQQLGMPFRAQ